MKEKVIVRDFLVPVRVGFLAASPANNLDRFRHLSAAGISPLEA
jgi:hypothetical protein